MRIAGLAGSRATRREILGCNWQGLVSATPFEARIANAEQSRVHTMLIIGGKDMEAGAVGQVARNHVARDLTHLGLPGIFPP